MLPAGNLLSYNCKLLIYSSFLFFLFIAVECSDFSDGEDRSIRSPVPNEFTGQIGNDGGCVSFGCLTLRLSACIWNLQINNNTVVVIHCYFLVVLLFFGFIFMLLTKLS